MAALTEAEYDEALDRVVKAVLARLDTNPLRLGSRRREHHPDASITIPLSSVLTEADLANAMADVLRDMRLEFSRWPD